MLVPKSNLEFALRGSEVWEYFVSENEDLPEAQRTLAYWIDDVRESNQGLIDRLLICFSVACVGLVIEAVLWALELGGTLS